MRPPYNVAGSFVGFLIETFGIESFRRLYETEDYDKAYGKSFDLLEAKWRQSFDERAGNRASRLLVPLKSS